MKKPRRPWEQMYAGKPARPGKKTSAKQEHRSEPPARREGGPPPERSTRPGKPVRTGDGAPPARRDTRPDRPARSWTGPPTERGARPSAQRSRPARPGGAQDIAASDTRPTLATYRLLIEYEGTRYSGWQEQKNAPTVMGALQRAIEEAGFPVRELGGAGRTDAGVHALAQCAHLRLGQRVDPEELVRALNKRLPRDVHVLAAAAADPSFHARHDAVSRSYLYQISRRRTALAKPSVWWVRDPIDLGRLRAAAALLVGRHDFRNFTDLDTGGKEGSTLVEVERVEVAEDGALILVRIVASHFLWKMVRRVIGALAQVGAGHLEVDAMGKLMAGAPLGPDDPHPAEWTAPPSGLFLERVLYAGDPPLASLTAVTKVAAAPALGTAGAPPPSRRDRRPPPVKRRRAPAPPD